MFLRQLLIFLSFFTLFSCNIEKDEIVVNQPKLKAQWLNPLFYNNDFEHELNFPLWFEDSIIKAHDIYKITKRIFRDNVLDSNGFNAIPKEKIEYYFDPNGYVDQLVIYSYLDDREVSRVSFEYKGNMFRSGYREVKPMTFVTLQKKGLEDEFTTDFFENITHQYVLYNIMSNIKKYIRFYDDSKKNNLFVMKNKKFWGPLSIDSILHPKSDDWVVLGSIRKPKKRFQVENIVALSNIHSFYYWDSGVIKEKIKEIYPFTYKRTYHYNKQHDWNKYIDSTFTDDEFITRAVHKINYDEFDRPNEIVHIRESMEGITSSYRETLSYRNRVKK
jgi:hypothetical protein